MNDCRILRTVIPIDDAWHTTELRGPIVHVATRHETLVEFWWLNNPDNPAEQRSFRVVGTGHPIPFAPLARHVGSAITPSGLFVWHLFMGFLDE